MTGLHLLLWLTSLFFPVPQGPIFGGTGGGGGSGTWTLVHHGASTYNGSCCSVTVTVPAVTAGNVLVATAFGEGCSGTTNINSVTGDSGSWSYPSAAGVCGTILTSGPDYGWVGGAANFNAGGGETSLVVSCTGCTGGLIAYVREYHYTGSTPTFDIANTTFDGSTTASTFSAPTLTITGTNDLIVFSGANVYSTISAISSPYSTAPNIDANYSGSTFATEAFPVSSYTAPTVTLSVSQTGGWGSNVIAIKGN